MRRVLKKSETSYSFAQKWLNSSGYKPHLANIDQELHPDEYAARVAYAESTLEKIKNSPDFVQLLLFSDEALFHLDGGINKHNSRQMSTYKLQLVDRENAAIS